MARARSRSFFAECHLTSSEGTGAVVEGRVGKDGVFQASTIMAKHAEEYSPHEGSQGAPNSFVPAKEYTAK